MSLSELSSTVNLNQDGDGASVASSLPSAPLESSSPISPTRTNASASPPPVPTFSVGQRVRVLSGRYPGREGVITGNESIFYVVALDGLAQPVYKRVDSLDMSSSPTPTPILRLPSPPVAAIPVVTPSQVQPEPIAARVVSRVSPMKPAPVFSYESYAPPQHTASSSPEVRRKRTAGSRMEWTQGQQIVITHGKGAGKLCTVVGSGHGFICVVLEDGKKLQKRVFELGLRESQPKKAKSLHHTAVAVPLAKREAKDQDMQSAAWTLLGIGSSSDNTDTSSMEDKENNNTSSSSSSSSTAVPEDVVAANVMPASCTSSTSRYSAHSSSAPVPAIALDHPSSSQSAYVYPYSSSSSSLASQAEVSRAQFRFVPQAMPYSVPTPTAAYIPGYPMGWYNYATPANTAIQAKS